MSDLYALYDGNRSAFGVIVPIAFLILAIVVGDIRPRPFEVGLSEVAILRPLPRSFGSRIGAATIVDGPNAFAPRSLAPGLARTSRVLAAVDPLSRSG